MPTGFLQKLIKKLDKTSPYKPYIQSISKGWDKLDKYLGGQNKDSIKFRRLAKLRTLNTVVLFFWSWVWYRTVKWKVNRIEVGKEKILIIQHDGERAEES